jgi:hypothetical protein
MTRTGLAVAANAEPDAVEANLRSWSWATGGWAGVHAGLAILALPMGAHLNLATPTLRVLGPLVVAAWATAATASCAFRRSFRMRSGLVAAGASLVAGALLPIVAGPGSGAIVDGVAHGLAGVGFAAALWRARAVLAAR